MIPPTDAPEVRPATAADVDGIAALCVDEFGAREGPNVRSVFDDRCPCMPLATVAVVGDEVVSTSLLLMHRLQIGAVEVPAAQIEWVATRDRYRRRGLVRRQFDLLQREAAARGALVEFISGIAHFYRRLGYAYGLDWPPIWALRRPLRAPDGLATRPAEEGDVTALLALERRAQRFADIASVRDERLWSWIAGLDVVDQWLQVSVRDGEVVGYARASYDEGVLWLSEVGGDDLDAATAAAAGAVGAGRACAGDGSDTLDDGSSLADDRSDVRLIGRGDPVVAALGDRYGVRADETHGLYVRLPDPLGLLRALRHELDARLADSGWRDRDGELLLSTYDRGFRLAFTAGRIIAVEPAEPLVHPESEGGIGIPEDHVAELLLGRRDPEELAARVDDVLLGRHVALARTLFPKLSCDMLPLAG